MCAFQCNALTVLAKNSDPRKRPESLIPLLLLFLRFIDFSAAPKHFRNASTAFTGMRAGGWAGHSTKLGLVHALITNWAPRLLPMQCPEFLTDCVIAFAEHGLPEQRVKLLSGGLQQEAKQRGIVRHTKVPGVA